MSAAESDADLWQSVCAVDDLEAERGVTALVHGQAIAIFRTYGGEVFALGNYDPFTGSSFVMAAGFDSRGRPSGSAILSYSQSENPESPNYADQTRLFSQEQWLPMRFSEADIKADPAYSRRVVTGRR